MLQQKFGYPCVEKLISFIFMYDVLGELRVLTGALLHFLLTNAKYMYFQWSKVKKTLLFEVGVFKQGDVLKQMFQKGYKIRFRMYLNLCNTKFSRIDEEKRVYKEVSLSLHFSIASFNMRPLFFLRHGAYRRIISACSEKKGLVTTELTTRSEDDLSSSAGLQVSLPKVR